jgi:bifunctional enzyme CysN/CysC
MPPAASLEGYVRGQADKDLLRLITCGSVDDGKSTLIGRLLYESKVLFDDQLAELERDSKRRGGSAAPLDFSLLVDGLSAEREQGITIDVAYRFFGTDKRDFIIADAPGHEQYTRNMVTGASTAELAIILVDSRRGVLVQTRRHSYLVALLGIERVVLAVNKMDAVDFSEARYAEIEADYRRLAGSLGLTEIIAVPLCALEGDNVIVRSPRTPWYRGPTLLEHLERVPVGRAPLDRPMRFPVQWVNRPNMSFRGYAGTVAAGRVRVGDAVCVMPRGTLAEVAGIVTFGGELAAARAGQSVTLTLKPEIDVSRGDIIAPADAAPAVTDQFQATLVWMHEEPMLPGRPYLLKLATQTVSAQITSIRHRVEMDTFAPTAARTLSMNEIGVCNLATDRLVAFDPYRALRQTGGFILIDRVTNDTVGAGMIEYALHRADNIHWQTTVVDRAGRAAQKGQRACIVWLTGLSGAGKTSIANLVELALHRAGKHTTLIDGDNVRHGLNKDLGFTDADRVENVRRVAEVAALMVDAGLITLVALISPFRSERAFARGRVARDEFIEVFIDTPLDVAEERDVKGLYKKARAGAIPHFTGISAPYEAPDHPELRIETTRVSAQEAADRIVAYLGARGFLAPG